MHRLYRSRRMARNRLSSLPYSRISSNSSFPAPHGGQTQSSGRRRNGVTGSPPLAGSPTSGSYTYAQTMHRYLAIAELLLGLSGTGGMISIATKEPQHRRGDLVGMVRPADAAAGAQAPPLGFREPRGGEREARGDRPDPHPRVENLFPGGRLVREGEFGEAVGKVAGPQVPRARVPQEDHGAAGLRPEEREKRLGEKERPAQVDREDPVPFPFGDIARRGAREDRGVVDEDVQPAEFPFDRTYETKKKLRAQKVEREGPPTDLPGEGTGLRARGAVGERDGEPIAGESAGDRRADAPGSPGDQRDLSRPGAHFSSMNFSFGAPQMGQGSGGSSPW